MSWKTLVLATALATTAAAHAQDKKALVAKVLQLQQPGIEATARILAEQPALQLLQQASIAIRARVPEDKREALAKEIQEETRKYVDSAVPPIRDAAVKLAPSTIGPILEEKFTTDELKQLIVILESPVNRKFQQLGGEMQRALSQKLVSEERDELEPKLRALQQAVGEKLRAAAGQPPASAPR